MTISPLSYGYLSTLYEWLLEVCQHYGVQIETLFFAKNILESFMNDKDISCIKLQLLGCVCLNLAYKISQPDDDFEFTIDTFVYISANAFDGKSFKTMEIELLKHFDYNIIPLLHSTIDYLNEKTSDTKTLQSYVLNEMRVEFHLLSKKTQKYITSEIRELTGFPVAPQI